MSGLRILSDLSFFLSGSGAKRGPLREIVFAASARCGRVGRMKRALVLAAAVWVAFSPLNAQTRATATNVPVIAHEAVPNFFKNPPGIYTGENMGIATSSK